MVRMVQSWSGLRTGRARGCFFFSSRRRHTRCLSDWSSDVCSSDLYHCSADGISQVAYKDTEHFQVTRDFLSNPERMLRVLLERGDDAQRRVAADAPKEIGRASCRERV